MTLRRRDFTLLGAALPFAALAAGPARAQAWPERTVTFIVPYPPGGVNDVVARGVMDKVSKDLGQPVVIDNKAGGGTTVASIFVKGARPDGYTLYGGGSSLAINPALKPGEPYDSLKDFTPVSLISRTSFVLHVNADLPIRSIPELVAWMKANPAKANYASSGIGAVNHLSSELLKQMAGFEATHIPFRGGALAGQAVAQGETAMMFSAVLEALPLLSAKKTRAIAISGPTRSAVLPDVPTVAEAGLAGYETTFWQGCFGPAGLPAAVVSKMQAAIAKACADPDLKKKFADQGTELVSSTPAELTALLTRDSKVWGDLIRARGIKAE